MAESESKEVEIKRIKEKMLKDTEMLSTKQRFALFSSPVPLGLGDDSYDFKKRRITSSSFSTKRRERQTDNRGSERESLES